MKTFAERNPIVVRSARGRGHPRGGACRAQLRKVAVRQLEPGSTRRTSPGRWAAHRRCGPGLRIQGGRGHRHRTRRPPRAGHLSVDKDIPPRRSHRAAIKTRSILGAKILELTPRGDGRRSGPIPLERTTSPISCRCPRRPDHDDQRTRHRPAVGLPWKVLADEFAGTPAVLEVALQGVARFSQTVDKRDDQLQAPHRCQSGDLGAGRPQRRHRQDAHRQRCPARRADESEPRSGPISGNIAMMSQQIAGLIAENRKTL